MITLLTIISIILVAWPFIKTWTDPWYNVHEKYQQACDKYWQATEKQYLNEEIRKQVLDKLWSDMDRLGNVLEELNEVRRKQ